MASKKSTKAKINAFKRLPTWAKVVVVVLTIAVLTAIIYTAVAQPQFIKDWFAKEEGGVLTDGELQSTFWMSGRATAF